MTNQTETARALLYRHGLPEDMIEPDSAAPAVPLPPADRAALRETAEAVLAVVEAALGDTLVPAARAEALAGIAAVLPATTDRSTEVGATGRCADCGGGFVPGSNVELTHNCDDHRDAEPAITDQTAEADQLATDYAEERAERKVVQDKLARARAELKRLRADRAAVLREAADVAEAQRQFEPAYGARKSAQVSENVGILRVAEELRRMAAETQPAETEHQPRRGDQFEAWLKTQRDKYDRHGESSEFWHEFDSALDLYRLHADMGVPLGGHVCEAKAVGDCECLEQPAAEKPIPVQHAPGKAIRCPDCRTKGYAVCLDGPAETDAHVCKPDAVVYYCPTSGETESSCHSGFDACCDRPDLHQPGAGARQDGAQR